MAVQQGFPNISAPFVTTPDGTIEKSWLRFLISLWLRTGSAQGGTTFTAGDLKSSASPNAQDGWLICDGAAVSRTDFPNLFAAISTIWGIGDGTTTFNVPDLRGRSQVGVGTSFTLGSVGGASSHTLTVLNLPAHNHVIIDPGHTHAFTGIAHTHSLADPGHLHGLTDPGHNHTALTFSGTAGYASGASSSTNLGVTGTSTTGITVNTATAGITANSTIATGSNATVTTGITTANTGSGTSFSTQSPYASVTMLIKT